mgnify:CR=1 FL=1
MFIPFIVLLFAAQDGKVIDVGVAMPMTSREVIHNARIVIEGKRIVKVGRRSEDLPVDPPWIIQHGGHSVGNYIRVQDMFPEFDYEALAA